VRAAKACLKERDLARRRALLDEGVLVLDDYDLTSRCPVLVLAQLARPEIARARYESDEVFLRSLVRRGVLETLRRGQGRSVRIEVPVELELGEHLDLPREIFPEGPASVEVVRVVSTIDALLVEEREILLVYYKSPRARELAPPHIDRAVLLHLLALENGYDVERVRIIYLEGLKGLVGEYVVHTRLAESAAARASVLEALAARVRGLVSLDHAPLYPSQCRECVLNPNAAGGLGEGTGYGCPRRVNPAIRPAWFYEQAGVEAGRDIAQDRTLRLTVKVLSEARAQRGRPRPLISWRGGRASVTLHPSRLAGCPLKLWYSVHAGPASWGEALSLRAVRGDILHSGIEALLAEASRRCPRLLASMGLESIRVEVPVEGVYRRGRVFYRVKGRVDVLAHTSDGAVVAYEIKTCWEEDCGKTARPHHAQQARIYKDLLEEEHGGPVEVRIAYIYVGAGGDGKATMTERVHTLGGDVLSVEELIDEAHRVGFEAGKPRAPRYEWECNFCEYRDICQGRG